MWVAREGAHRIIKPHQAELLSDDVKKTCVRLWKLPGKSLYEL